MAMIRPTTLIGVKADVFLEKLPNDWEMRDSDLPEFVLVLTGLNWNSLLCIIFGLTGPMSFGVPDGDIFCTPDMDGL